jgi:predicted lipoprotein with Yx(FWY)xxD motif
MRPLALIALAAALLVTPAASAASPRAKVLVRVTSVGAVLVDARGHTLYSFASDKGRTSACYGVCASTWPPLLTSGKPLAGSGVRSALLGMTKRTDGNLQVTYAGRPLYRFGGESGAAQLKGQGYLGLWWTLAPSGTKVTRKPVVAAPAPPATTTSGGGGYGYPGIGGGY